MAKQNTPTPTQKPGPRPTPTPSQRPPEREYGEQKGIGRPPTRK